MTGSLLAVTALKVDTGSFLVIVATAALAATLSAVAGLRDVFVPVVVVELVLGVLIGPQVLDLAQVNDFTDFFSSLGLGMLFFFAGYEIDLGRIAGLPLRLAPRRLGALARDRLHAGRDPRRARRRRLAGLRRAPRSRRPRSAR